MTLQEVSRAENTIIFRQRKPRGRVYNNNNDNNNNNEIIIIIKNNYEFELMGFVKQIYYRHTICIYIYIYLPNPSARAGYDTRSIFKQSLTGLNSQFSFS